MKKRKYQSNQMLLCIILDFLLIFTVSDKPNELLTLKGSFLVIPFILWALMITFFGLETKFKTGIIRMIYLIVTSCMSLLMLGYLEGSSAAIMFFSLGYTFLMIFTVVSPTKDKSSKLKILPIGHFSKKYHTLWNFTLIVIILISAVLSYVFVNFLHFETITSVILTFLIVFIGIYVVNLFINPLSKAILKFNNDIKFSEYEKTLLDLMSERTIHPDSRNYIMLVYVNYLYLHDIEAAIKYFEQITVPNYKPYRTYYDVIDTLNSFNKRDKEEAYIKLEQFKKQYPKHKYVTLLERTFVVSFTLDEIPNIKELYPIDKSINIQRLINAHLLMNYFKTRNNILEAKVYAQYVLEHANDLNGIIKEAQEVMDCDLNI